MNDRIIDNDQHEAEAAITDIAVIGMSGRFPQARDIDAFWQNLRNGVEAVTYFTDEELEAEGVERAVLSQPDYVKAGYILEDIELFDASFFGITPRDARLTDPQHRIFLECSYEALEKAGYDPERYKGMIGVYAGVGASTYLLHNLYSNPELIKSLSYHQILLTNEVDHLTTRVSYKLNLKGPSLAVQTTCSTSLVAISLACQHLLGYQCDMALAGGVSVLPMKTGYVREPGVLSPDGHIRAFDAQAQGIVPGSGVGLVVLKRLRDALADGDHIHAIVKGVAINNDGATKVGYTAPSIEGQVEVIAAAQAISRVAPETISYVETHGTATALGDPIEVAALTQAFRSATDRIGFCAIGSVKTNIGHTDAAAGVASFIKAVLALEHREIPPSLHFKQPNPQIDFANSPFYVNAALSPWKKTGTPRRAGVSSFGLGGTNAHVILEEAPTSRPPGGSRPWQLLTLSAKTVTALEAATRNLAAHLSQHPGESLADVAYTSHVSRKAYDHRRALVCRDGAEAVSMLGSLEPKDAPTRRVERDERPVVFMFPGQGSQYVGMASELFRTEPTFRETIKLCAETLRQQLGFDLRDLLFAEQETAINAERLRQPSISLLALFVVEYAQAVLLISWGIRPQAMIGHSIGEYVAACLAGVFSLEDALELVLLRGRLFESLPEGAMLTLALSETEVAPLLGEHLSLAAVNGPNTCLVSGPPAAIEELKQQLKRDRVGFRAVAALRAGHSTMVEPILKEFRNFLAAKSVNAPQIPFISNVTGTWISPAEATSPDYWTSHLRQTVRFSAGVVELLKDEARVLLEVGPGRTLTAFARKHLDRTIKRDLIQTIGEAGDERSDAAFMLEALGRLWLAGVKVDWEGFYCHERRRRVPLPTYPFQRQRHWIAPGKPERGKEGQPGEAQTLHSSEPFHAPSWRRTLGRAPRRISAHDQQEQSGAWVVFADASAISERLLTQLSDEGREPIVVRRGTQFQRSGNSYMVDPLRRSDYAALIREIEATGKSPTTFVHLWNMTSCAPGSEELNSFAEIQGRGFYSVLYLAQALQQRQPSPPLHLWVVSDGVQVVIGDETLRPEKATVLGACEAASQRYANIVCHHLDFALGQFGTETPTRQAEQLLYEIASPMPRASIALRAGQRWRPVSEPLAAQGDEAHTARARLKDGGVYLVTGGLEPSGFRFAQALAKLSKPKLILLDSHHENAVDNQVNHGFPLEMESEHRMVEQLEDHLSREIVVESYPPDLIRATNALCTSYICEYLQRNDLSLKQGARYRKDVLLRELGILPKFERFYDFFLRVLEEDKIIRREGDSLIFLQHPGEVESSAALRAHIEAEYPEFTKEFEFLDHCATLYKEALTGEVEAVSVLFPGGNTNVYVSLLDNWRRYSNASIYLKLIPQLVARAANESRRHPLRILEVGGGAGILTWEVVEQLRDCEVEFQFTDLGKAFVLNAERKAAREGFDFMKFGTLDISQEPTAQGYQGYSYDLILAFNVVHATKNIRETIGNLKRLLAPNGVLILLEVVTSRRSNTMVEGLAEGWWYYEDDDLRRETPLLNADQWQRLMDEQDCKTARIYPQQNERRAEANHVMVMLQQSAEITADDYLAQVAEAESQKKVRRESRQRRVESLKELGAEVLVAAADMADEEQMTAVLAGAEARYGHLNGVIHVAAGGQREDGGRSIESLAVNGHDRHLDGIAGFLTLERLLRRRELDFGLLVSYPSTAETALGLAAEIATGSFMDAFASQPRTSDWTSVKWSEPLNAETRASGSALVREWSSTPVTEPDISAALLSLLALESVPRIIVSPVLRSGRDISCDGKEEFQEAGFASEAEAARSDRGREGDADYVAPRNEREHAVAGIWSEVFGIPRIGIEDNFFDLGGESLLATQIVSRLRADFDIELPIRSFYENPTVEGIVIAMSRVLKASANAQEPMIMPVAREGFRTTQKLPAPR
ncbi:MAG: beta-ketoacyl synthase N-terminal-like domain-containing protein [Pyrinomonadaceae bacterium]